MLSALPMKDHLLGQFAASSPIGGVMLTGELGMYEVVHSNTPDCCSQDGPLSFQVPCLQGVENPKRSRSF